MEMDNNELTKKYILIIKEILQKELLNPTLKGSEDAEWSSWDVWNDKFNLMNWEFVSFFRILENKKIIQIVGSNFIDSYDNGEELGYLTDGTKEACVFYKRVDTEKAIQYKNELENSLSYPDKNISNILSNLNNKKKIINIDLGLPEKIEWDKVTIKIKDGLKDIEIFYNEKFKRLVSFDEIGFSSNKKNMKENRQWELLKILSYLLSEDKKSATPNTLSRMLSTQTNKKITIDNLHQIKKSLSESLKNIFKTEEDPFLDYKGRGYYEIKFKLLPVPGLRNKGKIWSNSSGYNDNIDSTSDEYKEYGEELMKEYIEDSFN